MNPDQQAKALKLLNGWLETYEVMIDIAKGNEILTGFINGACLYEPYNTRKFLQELKRDD